MILVDTHVVIWMTGDQSRISETALGAIRDARVANGGVAIASATLWELAMLVTRNRIQLPHSLGAYLDHVEATYVVLPLTGKIAERSMLFTDTFPADPNDRVIGATAVVHGLKLVTRDQAIRESNEVMCVW